MQGDPLDVKWARNKFHTYYALQKIRVGGSTETTIHPGDEFEYDGSILKYAGAEIPTASIRGVFRAGWVSDEPMGDDVSIAPFQAQRNVASSQSINRDLNNVQRSGSGQMGADNSDEDTVLNVSDRAAARNADGRGGHLTTKDNHRRGMRVDVEEPQEGKTVGRMRTSAKVKVDMTKASSHKIKDALDGISGSGYIPTQQARTRTVRQEGIEMKVISPMNRGVGAVAESDDEGRTVGSVRHSTTGRGSQEGLSVQDTSNIRNERAAARAAAERPVPSRQTKPTEYKSNTKLSPKVRVARAIDPSFPEGWSFEGKLADRLAAVKKHGATPQFLDALYAAEGDQMRKALEKAFPNQFLE